MANSPPFDLVLSSTSPPAWPRFGVSEHRGTCYVCVKAQHMFLCPSCCQNLCVTHFCRHPLLSSHCVHMARAFATVFPHAAKPLQSPMPIYQIWKFRYNCVSWKMLALRRPCCRPASASVGCYSPSPSSNKPTSKSNHLWSILIPQMAFNLIKKQIILYKLLILIKMRKSLLGKMLIDL